MGEYLRFAAVVLIGMILSMVIGKQSKDLSMLLTLAVCAMTCIAALTFLEPVIDFLRQLRRLGGLDMDAVSILMKTALIALVSELACVICADAGESSLGKVLQILSNAAILWLSLPLFQQILTMIEEVLTKL